MFVKRNIIWKIQFPLIKQTRRSLLPHTSLSLDSTKYCFLARVDFTEATMAKLEMGNPSKISLLTIGFTASSKSSLSSRADSASFRRVIGSKPSTSEAITRFSNGSQFSSIFALLFDLLIIPKRFTVISRPNGHVL